MALPSEPPQLKQAEPAGAPAKGRGRLRRSGNGRSRGETARSVALVVLAVLVTLFAVLNLKEVRVDWIFGSARAPLIIVIVISLLVGIVLTYIADRRSGRGR